MSLGDLAQAPAEAAVFKDGGAARFERLAAGGRRSTVRPSSLARLMPAMTRSRIRFRSSSATAATMVTMALPNGPVVLSSSRKENYWTTRRVNCKRIAPTAQTDELRRRLKMSSRDCRRNLPPHP